MTQFSTLVLQLNPMPNHAINPDVPKRRYALLWHAGYGERSVKKPNNYENKTIIPDTSSDRMSSCRMRQEWADGLRQVSGPVYSG